MGVKMKLKRPRALFGEPLVGFLGHMRRMVVEDDLDSCVGRIGGIKLLEEADELARAMAIFDAGVNLSREQVDACQQAQCPVTFVFVIACNARMLIRHRRQVRRGVGDRLDARFLVVGDERHRVARLLASLPAAASFKIFTSR